ncbi:MAG: hypothetical protein ACT4P1_15840 [Sporichthyaceae bacterium]
MMLTDLALSAAVKATMALPTADEVPNPPAQGPQEIKDKIDTVLGLLKLGVIAACVAGMLFVAAKAVLAHRRGELSDVMGQLGAVALGCVLVGSGSALVAFLM